MATDRQMRIDALRRLTHDLYVVKGAWSQNQIADFVGMSPAWVSHQLNEVKNSFPERLSEQMVMELDAEEASFQRDQLAEMGDMIANLSGALMQMSKAICDCASRIGSIGRDAVGDTDAGHKC